MKKYLLGLFAVALAIGFSAFTSARKENTAANLETWYFIGTTLSQAQTASQYQVFDEQEACTIGEELPCKIQFDASQFTPVSPRTTALEEYLYQKGSPSAVLADAIEKRAE